MFQDVLNKYYPIIHKVLFYILVCELIKVYKYKLIKFII